jgi:hypothetical protein
VIVDKGLTLSEGRKKEGKKRRPRELGISKSPVIQERPIFSLIPTFHLSSLYPS